MQASVSGAKIQRVRSGPRRVSMPHSCTQLSRLQETVPFRNDVQALLSNAEDRGAAPTPTTISVGNLSVVMQVPVSILRAVDCKLRSKRFRAHEISSTPHTNVHSASPPPMT